MRSRSGEQRWRQREEQRGKDSSSVTRGPSTGEEWSLGRQLSKRYSFRTATALPCCSDSPSTTRTQPFGSTGSVCQKRVLIPMPVSLSSLLMPSCSSESSSPLPHRPSSATRWTSSTRHTPGNSASRSVATEGPRLWRW